MLKRWRCCVPGSVDIECNECHLLSNSPFKWALSCTYDDFAEIKAAQIFDKEPFF